MRILANRQAKIWAHLEDDDGNLIAADVAPAPTVTITRFDGTAVAGPLATTISATGTYQAVVPAQTASDVLVATWTFTVGGQTEIVTDLLIVVARRLVPLWLLRTDADLAALTGETLRLAADAAEDECISSLWYPPVPQPERIPIRSVGDLHMFGPVYNGPFSTGPYGGWGGPRLMTPNAYPQQLLAGTRPSGAALTSAELALISAREGWLEWVDYRNWDPGEWQMWLLHGRWTVPPNDLVRAAIRRTRYMARWLAGGDSLPDRASQVVTDGATVVLAYPKLEMPTGMPEVDIVYARYRAPGL